MKEILMLSGKGGTGKTGLTAALAQLAPAPVVVDCDVDAADLHLLLAPEILETHPFVAGWIPVLNPELCRKCGCCYDVCRFDALVRDGSGVPVFHDGCEGCGVCALSCPQEAIALAPRECGVWHRSRIAAGTMFHARLHPGEENSGKLIAEIRTHARETAQRNGARWLLADGPPGIGCPVISALTGTDFVLLVTEPTISGIHDMKRTMELIRQFRIDFAVVINKYDLNCAGAAEIEEFCRETTVDIAGRIDFDPLFGQLLHRGETILAAPETRPARQVEAVWQYILQHLNEKGS